MTTTGEAVVDRMHASFAGALNHSDLATVLDMVCDRLPHRTRDEQAALYRLAKQLDNPFVCWSARVSETWTAVVGDAPADPGVAFDETEWRTPYVSVDTLTALWAIRAAVVVLVAAFLGIGGLVVWAKR